MAAFQALGGFIATFADPQKTGLQLSDDETVVYDESIANNCHERYLELFNVKLCKLGVILIIK